MLILDPVLPMAKQLNLPSANTGPIKDRPDPSLEKDLTEKELPASWFS
jgi:hypothetical protein